MSTEIKTADEPTENVTREATRGGRFYRPNVDIIETESELLLKADMPGTRADRVSLNYNNGTLTLHAAVEERQPKGTPYLLQEYGVADFYREFLINEEVDSQGISAEYQDGVLTVHLPKSEQVKPRRIEVKAS